jgi:hypothetical protein
MNVRLVNSEDQWFLLRIDDELEYVRDMFLVLLEDKLLERRFIIEESKANQLTDQIEIT